MRLTTFVHYTAPCFLYTPKKDKNYILQFVLLKAAEKFQYGLFIVFTSKKVSSNSQLLLI